MSEYENVYVEIENTKQNSFKNKTPDNSDLPKYHEVKDKLPRPIWEKHETEIEAYYKAWEIAFSNLGKPTKENGFVSPYIDAAFNGDIFMWDSCFMLMFGRYGDSVFSFQKTLDNFYCKQEPDGFIGRQYHEDNGESKFARLDLVSTGPEILAWSEWQYYENYSDKKRLRDVYYVLLNYHRWLKNFHRWKDGSYWSTGWGCGMDNLPRHDMDAVPNSEDWRIGTYHHSFMSWIDANCQAALSCRELLKMADELEINEGVDELEKELKFLEKFINDKMWDEKDGYYYDLKNDDTFMKVKTIASYWTLLSNVASDDKADRLIEHLENENEFKRAHRVPVLTREDADYNPHGGYWNGGVWAPTNYMILCGLSLYNKDKLAYEIAKNHYENIIQVYKNTGTFWENYAPDFCEQGSPSSKDFVGWTGIVPITVLIEYILGIKVYAQKKEIVWRVNNLEKHGILSLPVGKDVFADLICEERNSLDEKPVVSIKCNENIKLTVIYNDEKSFVI